VLKNAYLTAHRTAENGGMRYLGERVDSLTVLELYKLNSSSRPVNTDVAVERPYTLYQSLEPFEKPESRRYYDDEVPKWYKNCQRANAKRKRNDWQS